MMHEPSKTEVDKNGSFNDSFKFVLNSYIVCEFFPGINFELGGTKSKVHIKWMG